MRRDKSLARRGAGELDRFGPWDMFSEMERMFRDFFTGPLPMLRPRWWGAGLSQEYAPDVDLRETDTEFILSACVPGMQKDDIDISVTRDSISISGERKSEEEKPDEKWHVRQQTYGSFKASYSLPAAVRTKDVKATYKNGVLEVVMPKAELTEAQKVKIEVSE